MANKPILSANPACVFVGESALNTESIVVDLGYPHSNHTMQVICGGSPSAGVVSLYGSLDGNTWSTTPMVSTNAITTTDTLIRTVTGIPVRYLKAVITTGIVAGTVTVFIGSADSNWNSGTFAESNNAVLTGTTTFSGDVKFTGDSPWIDITAYGAHTSSTDNGPAINDAITAASTIPGGVVYIPPGTFNFTTQIDLDDARGIVLVGNSAPTSGAGMASKLVYTGTGADAAITARGSYGVIFKNLTILYTQETHTGYLIDYSGNTADTAFGVIDTCYLGGSGITNPSAAAMVYLDKAIIMTIKNSYISYGVYGVLGKSIEASYSNAIQIDNTTFIYNETTHVRNPGQAWIISGCTFEQLIGNVAGAINHDLNVLFEGLTVTGCWTGDSTSGVQFTLAGNSAVFIGNWIGSTGGQGIYTDEVVDGLIIKGNRFRSCVDAIKTIQPGGSASARSWEINGNTYSGVTNKLTGNFAGGTIYNDDASQSASAGLCLYGARVNGSLYMVNGNNIEVGTATGTKIGTAAAQKLGFYNATPIVQPSATSPDATDLATAITLVNNLKTKLIALGLIA